LNNQSIELKQKVMDRLLKKVTDLETKVTGDVNKPQLPKKMSLMERLASKAAANRAGEASEVASNVGSEKAANAKALLNQLFKKKF